MDGAAPPIAPRPAGMADAAPAQAGASPAVPAPGYAATRARVEHYFDRTATTAWERLTSDAPVSRIRATVRAGRAEMRALILSRLPDDLTGARVLDAGCGTGALSAELAARGAEVVGIDISPRLVAIAEARLPDHLRGRVRFAAGDMLDGGLGRFDHAVAMDSLIYYGAADVAGAVARLGRRCGQSVTVTVAPGTPLLRAMWMAGRAFPRADRAPAMVPHSARRLRSASGGALKRIGRVSRGFYISEAWEARP